MENIRFDSYGTFSEKAESVRIRTVKLLKCYANFSRWTILVWDSNWLWIEFGIQPSILLGVIGFSSSLYPFHFPSLSLGVANFECIFHRQEGKMGTYMVGVCRISIMRKGIYCIYILLHCRSVFAGFFFYSKRNLFSPSAVRSLMIHKWSDRIFFAGMWVPSRSMAIEILCGGPGCSVLEENAIGLKLETARD